MLHVVVEVPPVVDAATEHVHAVRHDVAGGAEERRGVKTTR